MVKKKKKEGDFIANQPVTMSFYYDYDYDSCDDTSDNDIVFEDDKPTIISDPNDIDSDNDNSADDSNDASANESDSGDLMSSYSSTFVINIRTVHTANNPSKRVRFNDHIITHVIEIEDRKGYWVEDRFRFQQRCMSVKDAISFIFDEIHRRKMRLIVNLSDSLRGAIMPYELLQSTINPTTIFSYSNISRDHSTIMRPIHANRPWNLPTWLRS
jgi:hypothetical protein